MISKNIDNKSQLDKKGVIQSGSLAGKSLWVAIWFLAIPILIQQILVAFVGLADKMFAGGLPEAIVLPSMDAIGIGSYVGWFISIAVSGIGIGSQALIARAMGSGDMEQGKSVLGQSLSLAFFWGIVISVGLWLFAKPLGELCQLSESAQIYLVQYVHVIAIGMPACAVMQTGAMCLHGSGDTIRPAVVMLFVNIVNVFFSWIFSGADLQFGGYNITNPFSLDYHVIGIAIGTSISYLVGALLIILVLARGIGSFKVQLSYLSLDIAVFWRISKIGIPSFFEGLSMWLANLFVLQFIGQIAARLAVRSGSETQVIEGLQGAHVIAVQWESFSFLPGFAIGIASGTLAGQYLCANNIK